MTIPTRHAKRPSATRIPENCPLCGQSLAPDVAANFRNLERRFLAGVKRKLALQPPDAVVAAEIRQLRRLNEEQRTKLEDQERRIQRMAPDQRGEIHEADVAALLKSIFPSDAIQRFGKAGDITQTVDHITPTGQRTRCGVILYECKNWNRWDNAFIKQILEAGRIRKTQYLVLVSRRLPRNEGPIFMRQGVFVVSPAPAHVTIVATLLRDAIIRIHQAHLTAGGQTQKVADLYQYLTGESFKSSLRTLIRTASELDGLLTDERIKHERLWWTNRQAAYAVLAGSLAGIDTNITAILETKASVRSVRRPRLVKASGV